MFNFQPKNIKHAKNLSVSHTWGWGLIKTDSIKTRQGIQQRLQINGYKYVQNFILKQLKENVIAIT